MKLFKLLLLKAWVIAQVLFVVAFPFFGLQLLGVNAWLAFFIGLALTLWIINTDDRDWKEKAILNFPLSAYSRRSRPPRPPKV
jgi:hypothetical protein